MLAVVYTKAEACIAGEALARKSACEVGRNYAKFEFTVVDNGENVESSCRLGWFNTFGCLVYGGVAEVEVGE